MSERISRSEPDGSLSQGPDRSSRLHGAALGCVGTLLTLMLGGGVLMLVTAALTIGPGGSEVERHLLAHIWQFSFGIWLIVPATLVGTMIGYDKTLEYFSHFWGTAYRRSTTLSIVLWGMLAVICKLTQIVVNLIM